MTAPTKRLPQSSSYLLWPPLREGGQPLSAGERLRQAVQNAAHLVVGGGKAVWSAYPPSLRPVTFKVSFIVMTATAAAHVSRVLTSRIFDPPPPPGASELTSTMQAYTDEEKAWGTRIGFQACCDLLCIAIALSCLNSRAAKYGAFTPLTKRSVCAISLGLVVLPSNCKILWLFLHRWLRGCLREQYDSLRMQSSPTLEIPRMPDRMPYDIALFGASVIAVAGLVHAIKQMEIPLTPGSFSLIAALLGYRWDHSMATMQGEEGMFKNEKCRRHYRLMAARVSAVALFVFLVTTGGVYGSSFVCKGCPPSSLQRSALCGFVAAAFSALHSPPLRNIAAKKHTQYNVPHRIEQIIHTGCATAFFTTVVTAIGVAASHGLAAYRK